MKNNSPGNIIRLFGNSVLYSYSQVFFSKNKIFAIILLIVTFFDVYAGLAGMTSVVISGITAFAFGINREKIASGIYGFNNLMVGLGLGLLYEPSIELYLVLLFISVFTFFITLSLEGVIGKYGLPYLSVPFLFGLWFVLVAAKGYSALEISERGIFALNDMYAIGGMKMVHVYQWFNEIGIAEALRIYFKSLSAILFQYHLFAGFLIAAGLLYFSRVSFVMSLVGFFSAWIYYLVIGANISELNYSYIGFNYILSAIAIGGIFIVPSRRTFFWVIMLTPLVAITLSATSVVFMFFGLSVYSLPFNIIVLLFLYVLKFREKISGKLSVVTLQQNSPELHAYSYNSFIDRFGNIPLHSMKLPFWGEWKVTQSHNGEITHKDNWRHAWDFEIVDILNKTYRNKGTIPEEYFCFNKPVVAPADGVVVKLVSDIDDNIIGHVNLHQNWGNTVVIKHAEHLYSQISHLKKDSITVKQGQNVKQGEIIGYCGNSGRSPYPHLHFQFQTIGIIGAQTLEYPFTSIIVKKEENPVLLTASIPEKDNIVQNIVTQQQLKNAFSFIPGSKIIFETIEDGKTQVHTWEVKTDIYNNTSIECADTSDIMWYNNNDEIFRAISYRGSKKSLLYYFFLAAYKVTLAYYQGLKLTDNYPLDIYPNKALLLVQDFLISFGTVLKAEYSLGYKSDGDILSEKNFTLSSQSDFKIGKTRISSVSTDIVISEKGIDKIVINNDKILCAERKY